MISTALQKDIEKYEQHHLDPDLKWLMDNPIQLTEEELKDKRTRHIMKISPFLIGIAK